MNILSLATLALGFSLLPRLIAPGRAGLRDRAGSARTSALWWANFAYCRAFHRLEVENECPLPEEGPAVLIANHTCCIDHMLLQAACHRLLGFMVAEEYYKLWWAAPFSRLIGCIPVKRDGSDLAATRIALRVLKEGRVLPIFPAGRITPDSGETIGPSQPGAGFLALKARVPVIPAYIRGTPRTNEIIPSLFTPSRTRIRFGPPVLLDDLADQDRDRAVDRLSKALESLADEARRNP